MGETPTREMGELGQRIGLAMITRDRRDLVLETLAELRPLGVPVAVVDDGSRDGTHEAIAREHPWATVGRLERSLGAEGRNVAAAMLDVPYVAVCDDDSHWPHRSLELAVEELDRRPRLGLLCARLLVEPRDPGRQPYWDPGCEGPVRQDGGIMACALVLRRSAWEAAGGFRGPVAGYDEEAGLLRRVREAGFEAARGAFHAVHRPATGVRYGGSR